jgi:hypothetical protein
MFGPVSKSQSDVTVAINRYVYRIAHFCSQKVYLRISDRSLMSDFNYPKVYIAMTTQT